MIILPIFKINGGLVVTTLTIDETVNVMCVRQAVAANNIAVMTNLNLSTAKSSGPLNLTAANSATTMSKTIGTSLINGMSALNTVNLSVNKTAQQYSQVIASNAIAVITIRQQSSSDGSVYEDDVNVDTTIAINSACVLSESESVILERVIAIISSSQQLASNTINFSLALMSSVITQCIALANSNAGYRITVSAENGEVETVITTPESRIIKVRFVSRIIKINN